MSVASVFGFAELFARAVKPWDVPRVLIDADALRAGARSIANAAFEVEQATAATLRVWQRLPDVLSAPGAIEPLYSGMVEPASQGTELQAVCARIEQHLGQLADAVERWKPRLSALRGEVEQLNAEIEAAAISSASLTDIVLDPLLPLLTARSERLQAEVDRSTTEWREAVGTVATALAGLRAGLDVALIVGSDAARTAGLVGATVGDPSRADFDLLREWALGVGPRHRVFTADDPFTRLVRRDSTIRADVRVARELLSQRGWAYGDALVPPDDGTFGRSVSGLRGARIAAGDLGTWLNHLAGRNTGNIADSFLGSYAVEIVPLAKVGPRSVRVSFTVKNATTLASGTRPPIVGYGAALEEFGRFKNDQVPTGPMSETTQTITWTQVISWPARSRLRRTEVAP